jgi:hypothetical protein
MVNFAVSFVNDSPDLTFSDLMLTPVSSSSNENGDDLWNGTT